MLPAWSSSMMIVPGDDRARTRRRRRTYWRCTTRQSASGLSKCDWRPTGRNCCVAWLAEDNAADADSEEFCEWQKSDAGGGIRWKARAWSAPNDTPFHSAWRRSFSRYFSLVRPQWAIRSFAFQLVFRFSCLLLVHCQEFWWLMLVFYHPRLIIERH